MSDPSWLQDEGDNLSGSTSQQQPTANNSVPRAPAGPKPVTPSRKQVQTKNAQLEEDGLDFLKADVTDNGAVVVKETRAGVAIEDEELTSPSKTLNTNAPVHFLKRMREAEERRMQRLERTANKDSNPPSNSHAPKKAPIRSRPPNEQESDSKKGDASDDDSSTPQPPSQPKSLNSTTNFNGTLSSPTTALGSDGGIVETEFVDLTIVPQLSEDDKSDYQQSIAYFGEGTIRKLRSNRYQHRVEAVRLIKQAAISRKHLQEEQELEQVEVEDDEDEFGVKRDRTSEELEKIERQKADRLRKLEERSLVEGNAEVALSVSDTSDAERLIALTEVLGTALKDSIFHVVVAACDLADGVLETYAILDKSYVDDHLRLTIATLITKLKDSNSRVKEAATATLINLSSHISVGPQMIVRQVAKSVPAPAGVDSTDAIPAPSPRDDWKYTVAKIDLCYSILEARSKHISSVSDESLRIATHGLGSANPQARKRAAAFFGLVRGECGTDGIKQYLSTISPATIKMLKHELGIDENATLSGSIGASSTAARLAVALTLDEDQAAKEETEDIAAFEADGDSLTEDQEALADFLKGQFPELKTFSMLFSSRWNLRERLLLRLHTVLEDKSLGLSGEGSIGVMAKLTACNIQLANASLGAAGDSQAADTTGVGTPVDAGASGSSFPVIAAADGPSKSAVKRFLQRDDDDDSDEEDVGRKGITSVRATPLARQNRSAGTQSTGTQQQLYQDDRPCVVNAAQLGAIIGICEKGFTDSVPAVASAAVRLLKAALTGYKSDQHKSVTPPPPTPVADATRDDQAATNKISRANSNASAFTSTSQSDDVPHSLHMLVPRLVALTTGSHTGEGSLEVLCLVASLPFITLNGALSDIIDMSTPEQVAKASVKSICARLDSITHLLLTVTTDKNIDISKVVAFAIASFQHREPKARTSAASTVIELYKRVGDRIQSHLERLKGAAADDLKARMAKISKREKQRNGATAKVRLAVFDNAGGILGSPNSVPLPAPPSGPNPFKNGGRPAPPSGEHNNNSSLLSPRGLVGIIPGATTEMAQGKNRKGNLVFS